MKQRTIEYGNKNIVGKRIESFRKKNDLKQKDLLSKLQILGVDLTPSALSKIEGQIRTVADFEVLAISKALSVSLEWLLTGKD